MNKHFDLEVKEGLVTQIGTDTGTVGHKGLFKHSTGVDIEVKKPA